MKNAAQSSSRRTGRQVVLPWQWKAVWWWWWRGGVGMSLAGTGNAPVIHRFSSVAIVIQH